MYDAMYEFVKQLAPLRITCHYDDDQICQNLKNGQEPNFTLVGVKFPPNFAPPTLYTFKKIILIFLEMDILWQC